MISAITGELRRVEDERVHVACGTVIFEILVPAFDRNELNSAIGREITLHTIFDIEGDPTRGGLAPRLIGFLRPEDKQFFELFITVKGIGPKKALRALVNRVGEIAAAIEAKNSRYLLELPEIGRRTAEQIIAELSGKMADLAHGYPVAAAPAARQGVEQDAIEGATLLGIPRTDAERLLDRAKLADTKPKTADALIREMLRLRTARV
jgi:holliday junction DNA helicase RuvA